MRCARDIKVYIQNFARTVKNKRILDVGCGKGDYTSLFNLNNNEVYGLDIADYRLAEYKDCFNFKLYDGKRLPFQDSFFDVVISFDVIEHIEDDREFIREIYRVLKPQGQVFLSTPNQNRFSNIIRRIIGKQISYPLIISRNTDLGDLIHIREYTNQELLTLFKNNKFKNIEIINFWFGLRAIIIEWFSILKPFIFKKYSQYLFVKAEK